MGNPFERALEMEIWQMVANLPVPALAVLALIALAAFATHGTNFYRLLRVRDDIRASLAREGYDIRELELRWLTRGSFPDLRRPGLRGSRGQYLYYVAARDRGGCPLTGWVRWSAGWPWRPREPWSVSWDEAPAAGRKGLSTVQFLALALAPVVIVLLVVGR